MPVYIGPYYRFGVWWRDVGTRKWHKLDPVGTVEYTVPDEQSKGRVTVVVRDGDQWGIFPRCHMTHDEEFARLEIIPTPLNHATTVACPPASLRPLRLSRGACTFVLPRRRRRVRASLTSSPKR